MEEFEVGEGAERVVETLQRRGGAHHGFKGDFGNLGHGVANLEVAQRTAEVKNSLQVAAPVGVLAMGPVLARSVDGEGLNERTDGGGAQ